MVVCSVSLYVSLRWTPTKPGIGRQYRWLDGARVKMFCMYYPCSALDNPVDGMQVAKTYSVNPKVIKEGKKVVLKKMNLYIFYELSVLFATPK